MATMDMAAKPDGAAMPCCPDAKQKPGQPQKQSGKDCAQTCAAMNAVAVAVAPISFAKPLLVARVVQAASAAASARTFEPLGLKRPPRRIA